MLIAMGSNEASERGNPRETLAFALSRIASKDLLIRAVSRFYSTPCFPAGAGPDFVNAAIAISTRKTPPEVLQILQKVEQEAGRARIERWGARTLDLDLIGADATVLPDEATQMRWQTMPLDQQAKLAPDELILPHPRVQDRAFVLVPLADVAPDWRHPVLGHSVRQMLDALAVEDRAGVRPLTD